VALATPMGRSGIGVVRVSGPQTEKIAQRFFKGTSALCHRQAVVGRWQDISGQLIDEVVVVFYRGPHSYTGEDVLEISAHGNPLVLNKIISMIQSSGARGAFPGEFTLRAVAHGKMDLIQAEAVRDFIEAQTDAQARTALRQLGGVLSKQIAPVKEELVDVIARLEAGIDFAEDDVEVPNNEEVERILSQLRADLERLQETYAYGKLLTTGVRIVIAGKPNVGKSSLFNRLVAADRAIVTDVPGTTRDVISEPAELEGIPLRLFDTAGIRETEDRVESIGVSRTLETVTDADLTLFVVDGSMPLDAADLVARQHIEALPHLVVANKADLASKIEFPESWSAISVSAKTGTGLMALRHAVREFLHSSRAQGIPDSILTSARQSETVLRAIAALRAGESALATRTPHEMVLLDLYQALSALNELTGEITTEDILGRIFSSFCIGK
jgi:tRNA modification GTPase